MEDRLHLQPVAPVTEPGRHRLIRLPSTGSSPLSSVTHTPCKQSFKQTNRCTGASKAAGRFLH